MRLDGIIRLPFTQEDGFAVEEYSQDLMPLSCKIMSENNKCKMLCQLLYLIYSGEERYVWKILKTYKGFFKKNT